MSAAAYGSIVSVPQKALPGQALPYFVELCARMRLTISRNRRAARKVRPLAVHHDPFIQAAHALGAELAAQPADVIHQHDFHHTQARRLDRGGAGGLTAADDAQVGLDDFGRAASSKQKCGNKQGEFSFHEGIQATTLRSTNSTEQEGPL